MNPDLAIEVDGKIASGHYDEALALCSEQVRRDPLNVEWQDKCIQVMLDFIRSARPKPDTKLKILSDALRFGRRIDEIAPLYFPALRLSISDRPPLAQPGILAIGLGPGRNGSTSLAALLGSNEDSISTHEVFPMIHFPPTSEQIRFHLMRFKLLLERFPLVAETSHWMLYIRDALLKRFPDVRFVVLHRPVDQIVDSFIRVKGRANHWQESGDPHWNASFWDRCYPHYPALHPDDPEESRRRQIERYAREYYLNCRSIPDANRIDLQLDEIKSGGLSKLEEFIGIPLSSERAHLNRKTVQDSIDRQKGEF